MLYKLVEQLKNESDRAEALDNEVKKDGVDLQDRLNETVDTVLNGKKNQANKNTAVKIKKADGTVVIDEKREAKKTKAMANTLDGTVNLYIVVWN